MLKLSYIIFFFLFFWGHRPLLTLQYSSFQDRYHNRESNRLYKDEIQCYIKAILSASYISWRLSTLNAFSILFSPFLCDMSSNWISWCVRIGEHTFTCLLIDCGIVLIAGASYCIVSWKH